MIMIIKLNLRNDLDLPRLLPSRFLRAGVFPGP